MVVPVLNDGDQANEDKDSRNNYKSLGRRLVLRGLILCLKLFIAQLK